MDIKTLTQRESMLRLRENLISSEKDRLHGKKGYSVKEVSTMMKDTVKEIVDGKEK